jgi:hypothetical protein
MKTHIPFDTTTFGIIPGIDDFPRSERLSSSYYMWRVWERDEFGSNRQGIVRKTQEGQYQLVIPCIFHEIKPVPFGNTAQEPLIFLVREFADPKDTFTLFDIEKARRLTFQIAGKSGLTMKDVQSCTHVNGPANAPIFLLNQQFLFDQTGAGVVIQLPGIISFPQDVTVFEDGNGLRVLALCNRGTEKPIVACVTDVLLGRLRVVLYHNQ